MFTSIHKTIIGESERNEKEIAYAVELANAYPDIIKVLAVGNEAMVKWATSYYVQPEVIMKSIGVDKPIHIGETGWANISDGFYGPEGSRAKDEYKQGLYYQQIREWTNTAGISCFYFEAFDEQRKDDQNSEGSENHFGLINLKGQAKYSL